MKTLKIVPIAAPLLLAACQSMTPTECRISNWGQLGQQDGNQGRSEQIARHVDSCAQQQVSVSASSINAYRIGYQQGLGYYCQPQRILDLALDGEGSLEQCPLASQARLQPYYRAGAALYTQQKSLKSLSDEEKQLEQELLSYKTSDQRRIEIRQRLRKLDRELVDTRDQLRDAEYAVQRLR